MKGSNLGKCKVFGRIDILVCVLRPQVVFPSPILMLVEADIDSELQLRPQFRCAQAELRSPGTAAIQSDSNNSALIVPSTRIISGGTSHAGHDSLTRDSAAVS